MTERPCKDGRHSFKILDTIFAHDLKCENEGCPIVIFKDEIILTKNKKDLLALVIRKENEWWAKQEMLG